MYLSKLSIICTLWYEFLNDLYSQRDFDKKFVTKKPVNLNHSYLKYALNYKQFFQYIFEEMSQINPHLSYDTFRQP